MVRRETAIQSAIATSRVSRVKVRGTAESYYSVASLSAVLSATASLLLSVYMYVV